ncbi:hypothetical protein V1272_002816 [Bradyrhizobium sp. AZCC 1708]
MTPRYKRKIVSRYKPKRTLPGRPKIKPADPAVLDAFQKLYEVRTAREEAHDMPDFAPPELFDRCERDCWERLMMLLLRSPIPSPD